jgi:Protein of unknown function (DUF2934)
MPRAKNPDTPAVRKRAPRKGAAATATETDYPNFVDPQQRAALIARAAYFRAMNRGFVPGHEEQDWLAAEVEVDAELLSGTPKSARV